MMLSLSSPVIKVAGIGEALVKKLAEKNINTVKDLLLFLPLHYIDRSKIIKINQLEEGEIITLKAHLLSISSYYKNRKTITRAKIQDDTGQLNCLWFNNKFLKNTLKKGEEYYFSCKITDRNTLLQPVVEEIKQDTLHTGRLVPIYSSILSLKQGQLRRILKNTLNNLKPDEICNKTIDQIYPTITQTFNQLHFPNLEEKVIKARERLALEELLALIAKSKRIKTNWQKQIAHQIKILEPILPKTIPFKLTGSQQKAVKEIIADLKQTTAMNRLLIGDVGSGKTVVAAIACKQVINNNLNAALVAPTQILAQQHAETLKKLFPDLKIKLIIGSGKKVTFDLLPSLYIGTHTLINHLDQIKPALLIYDEQHRFGVKQRSKAANLKPKPHILTMSATPIPRSLMLTIFSHLSLSYLNELPAGQKPTKTWYVPNSKKTDSLLWLEKKVLTENSQALIICPFIDPSNHEAFENVAAATDIYETVKKSIKNPKINIALLHSKLNKDDKNRLIRELFDQKIQVLVSTPIVEVGVDLPAANIILIEAADRFGMASLHQLRGRVGRAGQESFCLLFTNSQSTISKQRLKLFSQENDGLKLAELDLKNRGAGDIFGTQQHGFDNLKFASWANLELINQAREIYVDVEKEYLPFFEFEEQKNTAPMAN